MRITRGAVIAMAVGAVVLAGTIAGGAHIGRTLAEKHTTDIPTPSASAPAPPAPAPAVTASPSVTPSLSPSPSRTPSRAPARQPDRRTLLNLRDILPEITVTVPAGAGCPAATVRFDGSGGGRSKGVDYQMTDEPGSNYGDLTGDGHEELMLPLFCGDSPGTLLIIAATSPTAYAVKAALPRPDYVIRTDLQGQRLRIYGPGGKVREVYRLSGNRLVRATG